MGVSWWPPCPTVCWAQLRLNVTAKSECYDSCNRLVTNRTIVSIACLRLGAVSHCSAQNTWKRRSPIPHQKLHQLRLNDSLLADLTSVCGCSSMLGPMSTSRWTNCFADFDQFELVWSNFREGFKPFRIPFHVAGLLWLHTAPHCRTQRVQVDSVIPKRLKSKFNAINPLK